MYENSVDFVDLAINTLICDVIYLFLLPFCLEMKIKISYNATKDNFDNSNQTYD